MVRHELRVPVALAVLLCWCACGYAAKDEKKAVVAQVQNPFAEQEGDDAQSPQTALIPIYEGEDAASAAQRIAEENNIFSGENILEIARAYKEQLAAQDDFTIPKALILRTGGAYLRRADEHIKAKKFSDGAADCLRALMRPGLDPTATEPMMKKLDHALLRMQRIREMAEQDAQLEEEKYAVQNEESEKLAKEWAVILAEDDRLWRAIDKSQATAASTKGNAEGKEVAAIDLKLSDTTSDGSGDRSVRVQVREGEDAHHAAFHFCAANDIRSPQEVSKVGDLLAKELEKNDYKTPAHHRVTTAPEHMEKGRSHQDNFELGHAGIQYARGLQAEGLTEEAKEDLERLLGEVLAGYKHSVQFHSAWLEKNYQGVADAVKELPAALRSDMVQLILARAYSHTGKAKEAIAAITGLLNKCDKSGDWSVKEPRVIAAISGALLSLRFGDIEKAKKMYQIVLRSDPEQQYVKKRYKVLKQYNKMLDDIKELFKGNKNHDVVKAVDRNKKMLETVLGKEGAHHAGTRLLLFECKAKSAMTFHDDAIEACNTAIDQFENHDNPDPRRIAEAYAWRAEANMHDNSFDDAVADMQVALTKNPNSGEYQEQMNNAKEKQEEWNKSEEQHDSSYESIGSFYVNRPIRQMLDLPDNIDELDKDAKCKWLKSSFRKMSLRWHPDKTKGGKRRAQRKSSEMSEGKSLLEIQFGCKGKQRNRR